LREFGILLQEMPLGCNEAAARIRIDRSRQPLLFWWFDRGYRQDLWSLGWMDGKRLPTGAITWRTSLIEIGGMTRHGCPESEHHISPAASQTLAAR
jgi:hypothetical protein